MRKQDNTIPILLRNNNSTQDWDGLLGRILADGGSVVAKDSTLAPAYEFAFTDHLGSIRSLVTVGDSLFRKTEYGPYGEVLPENWTSTLVSPGGGSGGGGLIEEDDGEALCSQPIPLWMILGIICMIFQVLPLRNEESRCSFLEPSGHLEE